MPRKRIWQPWLAGESSHNAASELDSDFLAEFFRTLSLHHDQLESSHQ